MAEIDLMISHEEIVTDSSPHSVTNDYSLAKLSAEL